MGSGRRAGSHGSGGFGFGGNGRSAGRGFGLGFGFAWIMVDLPFGPCRITTAGEEEKCRGSRTGLKLLRLPQVGDQARPPATPTAGERRC
jgi:hypothetical protein